MSGHSHNHSHSHEGHSHSVTSTGRAFMTGIALNVIFVIAEFTAGFYYNSLALISDAGHNLSDVVSLLLALVAFRLAKVRSKSNFTYGYRKSTILVSLLNAVILLVVVGGIIWESIEKLGNPVPVEGGVIAWIAGIGVVINGVTAMLFMKNREKDLNVKGAYLHMLADALVSVGVLIAGLAISFTGWNIIDPIIGMVVAIVILLSTWGLLRDSLRLSLDGVPSGIDVEDTAKLINSIDGVTGVHHLHIWAISTTENALTGHIVLKDIASMAHVKEAVKHELSEHGISHSTLEFESRGEKCADL